MRAAFFAACERLRAPFVFAAFRAAADRSAAERFFAAAWACRDNAVRETDPVGSSFSRSTPARERFGDMGSPRWPFL